MTRPIATAGAGRMLTNAQFELLRGLLFDHRRRSYTMQEIELVDETKKAIEAIYFDDTTPRCAAAE
jgi:hypothetical protein